MGQDLIDQALRQWTENPGQASAWAVLTQFMRQERRSEGLAWLKAQQSLDLRQKLELLGCLGVEVEAVALKAADSNSTMVWFLGFEAEQPHVFGHLELEGVYDEAHIYDDNLVVISAGKRQMTVWKLSDIGGDSVMPHERADREIHSVRSLDGLLLAGGAEGGGWDDVEVCFKDKESWFAYWDAESTTWLKFAGIDQFPSRKAIDCITRYGSQMLAWDNLVLPKYVIEYDTTEGIANAQHERTIELPQHGLNESIRFAYHFDAFALYLSTTAHSLGSATHVSVVDTVNFNEQGSWRFQGYPARDFGPVLGFVCSESWSVICDRNQVLPWRWPEFIGTETPWTVPLANALPLRKELKVAPVSKQDENDFAIEKMGMLGSHHLWLIVSVIGVQSLIIWDLEAGSLLREKSQILEK